MNEAIVRSISSRNAVGTLVVFALIGGMLLAIGANDYPNLHTILDTGMALLSGALALLLWDMGWRIGRPFPQWLAIGFAAAFLLEFLHVLVTVEWSGALAPIAAAKGFLRPATWPPSAHVLPIAVGGALWQMRRGGDSVLFYAVAVAALGAGLLLVFQWLPTYTPAGALGITRPALILAPLLWAAVGIASWRLRSADRLMRPLAWMAAMLFLANAVMLYSTAPADGQAMVAHFGKICGYLALLLSLMGMASLDMAERLRAEASLARSNEDLEQRVGERTAQLEQQSATVDRLAQDRLDAINRLQSANDVLARQAEEIRRLSTPVLQLRDGLLLLPIIGLIDSQRARQLTDDLLGAIRDNRARVVVMDITGVAAVDSKIASLLIQMVGATRMMGATVIITGLSADIAQSLAGLGIDLTELITAGDLQSGLDSAEQLLRPSSIPDRPKTLSSRGNAAKAALGK